MGERPPIQPGDWITIGQTPCVVAQVRPPDHVFGDCEVVFNPSKPANVDAVWTGTEWAFRLKEDYGGYADKYDRLRHYVRILKSGRR